MRLPGSRFSLTRAACALALTGALAGCTDAADEDLDPAGPATDSIAADAKADSSELRIRAGSMTVWIDRAIDVRVTGGELVATITGRASRTLTGAFSFVPDDAFGTARLTGARSFAIDLHGGAELNSILSGLPLFVDLDAATGTEPDYALRLDLQPSFRKFTGSAALRVDTLVRPIFIGKDAPDPLRYHATIATTGTAPMTVTGVATPGIYPVTGGVAVDMTYPALDAALRAGGKLTFKQGAATKSAVLGASVTAIAMTTGDAYDTWPSPTCQLDVYNCQFEFQGVDLATCGDYREVSRCAYADVCEVTDAAPLALAPIDLAFVWADAATAYRNGCNGGGQWCELGEVAAFMLPECLAEVPTLAQVVAIAAAQTDDQDFTVGAFGDGTVLDRAGVQGTSFFTPSYSAGGPALFQAIDGHLGGGEVQGWLYKEEVPCPNCTTFRDKLFLWYPAAFRAVVLEGGHGYDS